MRLSAVTAISLLSTLVVSIDVPGIPSCASGCISGLGGCSQLDTKCICNNKPLIAHLSCCVSKHCDAADQKKTIQFAQGICAGTNANLPDHAGCAAASSLSSSAAASYPTHNAAASNRMFEGAGLGVVMAGLVAAL